MKFTAPKNPEKYFQESEHAVRHAYAGLDSCWSPYQEALTHYDISQLNQPLTPERKAALNRYLELANKHFDLKFSEATFAGSILQVAYMAIPNLFAQHDNPRELHRIGASRLKKSQAILHRERALRHPVRFDRLRWEEPV